jgi:uncharacterized membrane protein
VRLEQQTVLDARPSDVWAYVTDPANVPRFLEGVTRWDAQGQQRLGPGARLSVRMQVGTAHLGGLIEIIEWQDGREMAWTSITGVDQRGRWRLRPVDHDRTRFLLRLTYNVPGGLLGRLTELVAARMVNRNISRSLAKLKAQVER